MSTSHDFSSALLQTSDGVVVRVYVQPKARRSQLIGMHADRLKVAVTEPPEKGKATAAVIKLLTSVLNVSPSRAELVRGDISRQKDILIRGVTIGQVSQLFSATLIDHDKSAKANDTKSADP